MYRVPCLPQVHSCGASLRQAADLGLSCFFTLLFSPYEQLVTTCRLENCVPARLTSLYCLFTPASPVFTLNRSTSTQRALPPRKGRITHSDTPAPLAS